MAIFVVHSCYDSLVGRIEVWRETSQSCTPRSVGWKLTKVVQLASNPTKPVNKMLIDLQQVRHSIRNLHSIGSVDK